VATLIAYYSGETVGATVPDASGNGFDATGTNLAQVTSEPGVPGGGNAFGFAASGAALSVPLAAIPSAGDFALSFWSSPSVPDDVCPLRLQFGAQERVLEYYKPTEWYYGTQSATFALTAALLVVINVSYNTSFQTNTAEVYIGGMTTPVMTSFDPQDLVSVNFGLGFAGYPDFDWVDSLDNIAVWDGVLDANARADLLANPITGSPPPPPPDSSPVLPVATLVLDVSSLTPQLSHALPPTRVSLSTAVPDFYTYAGAIPGIVSAQVAGQQVKLLDLTLSADEESYAWLCRATLQRDTDYDLCLPDSEIIITIHNIIWRMQIVSRDLQQQYPQTRYSIEARSISANLSSVPKTQTYIDSSSCAIAAQADTTAIPDWPVDRWTAEQLTEVEICNQVAQACGSVLISRADGRLIIRPRHKQSVGNYISDAVLTESTVTTLGQSYNIRPGYNRVFVGRPPDELNSANISISEIERDETTDPSSVTLAVQCDPDASITTATSDLGTVSVTDLGAYITNHTQRIEIIEGVAQVSGQVVSLDSYDYGTATDLGLMSLDIETGEITTATAGYSLATISYSLRSRRVRVDFPQYYGQAIQIIVTSGEPMTDVLTDARRGAADTLSPDHLMHPLCTSPLAAELWARNYLDENGQGFDRYQLTTTWFTTDSGREILPGDILSIPAGLGRVTAISISAAHPTLRMALSVDIPRSL